MLIPGFPGSGPTKGGRYRQGPGVEEGPGTSRLPERSEERKAGTGSGRQGDGRRRAQRPRCVAASHSRLRKPSFEETHSTGREDRRSAPVLVHTEHVDALAPATPKRAARTFLDTERQHIPAARPGQAITTSDDGPLVPRATRAERGRGPAVRPFQAGRAARRAGRNRASTALQEGRGTPAGRRPYSRPNWSPIIEYLESGLVPDALSG